MTVLGFLLHDIVSSNSTGIKNLLGEVKGGKKSKISLRTFLIADIWICH